MSHQSELTQTATLIVHEAIRDGARYTVDEIARLVKMDPKVVRTAIHEGKLVARQSGRKFIIRGEDANQWQDNLPVYQPRKNTASESSRGNGAPSGMKAKTADVLALGSLRAPRRGSRERQR